MKRFALAFMLVAIGSFAADGLSAQKLGKFGKIAKGKLKKALEEATEVKPADQPQDQPSSSSDSNGESNKTLNKRMSPSEVNITLDDARSAFNSKNYSQSRFSIQQALIEIEQQLGEKVLAKMPKEALGQSYDPDQDRAISTGIGFIGLEIIRAYPSNKGDIQAIIANNSLIMGPYSMALSNPQYMSQNENMKSVSIDGKRGVLELDGDTYKLAIPFGQSSVFLLECESCNNESQITSLAKTFDLEDYLETLGEAPIQIDEK